MADPQTPTSEQLAALKQAVVMKAARFLKLPEAPLGVWGEYSEGGVGIASTRPDHAVKEVLYGLGGVNWDVDLTSLVTADDVRKEALGSPVEGTVPEASDDSIEEAIAAAAHWVASYLLSNGVGIG